MQEILLKIRCLERDLSKSFKKVNFIFSFEPSPFSLIRFEKQKRSETSNQFFSSLVTNNHLFRLQNKFRKIPLLVMCYLTKFDDVIWSGFWVIPKITSANFCKSIHDIIHYSPFICPFKSGKCGKEGKKLQKFEYLENEKSFFDEIKGIFHSFWRAVIRWKK